MSDQAVALLRRFEWGFDRPRHLNTCPVCGYPKDYRGGAPVGPTGHEPGCSMYAALNGLPAPRIAKEVERERALGAAGAVGGGQ